MPRAVAWRSEQVGLLCSYCVSGWNITIIATALYAVTGGLKLSKRAAFWAILGCIWLYTLFVGATPTVIRAAVMGTILVLGQRLMPARKSPRRSALPTRGVVRFRAGAPA